MREEEPMHRRLAVVAVVVVVCLVAALAVYFARRNAEDRGAVRLSGNIEVDEALLSFQVAGVLIERPVTEGDQVSAGGLIARLDTQDYSQQAAMRRAEMSAAEAGLAELAAGTRPEQLAQAGAVAAQARARLAELTSGARSQEVAQAEQAVAQAKAALAQAESQVELAEANLERSRQLFEAGVIPAQQYDSARTACEVAKKARDAAAAALKSAEERLSLTQEGARTEQIDQARAALAQAEAAYRERLNGPRKETIDAARARVEQARQAMALAETTLSRAELHAPSAGVVLSKSLEVGEYARPGAPVVTIGNLDEVYLRAYVSESDLGKVRLGQEVEVRTDTFPGKVYRGFVSYLSPEAEFTPKTVQTPEERVKLVYRVKIRLPNPEHELKPGMPADALIRPGAETP
jgi:HlyD family secretion protein